ncbi:hypothetical protein MKZ38_005819 [Zalerion maritima]|uniref:Uncharacterized protein n=1 Tax=Zalerion maritima TaxID=339359 RepID=A0AAD5RX72_9PEZI|nr:hypothetical protein MKZ38_005819 [Zalerion maritima]
MVFANLSRNGDGDDMVLDEVVPSCLRLRSPSPRCRLQEQEHRFHRRGNLKVLCFIVDHARERRSRSRSVSTRSCPKSTSGPTATVLEYEDDSLDSMPRAYGHPEYHKDNDGTTLGGDTEDGACTTPLLDDARSYITSSSAKDTPPANIELNIDSDMEEGLTPLLRDHSVEVEEDVARSSVVGDTPTMRDGGNTCPGHGIGIGTAGALELRLVLKGSDKDEEAAAAAAAVVVDKQQHDGEKEGEWENYYDARVCRWMEEVPDGEVPPASREAPLD